MHQTVKTRTKQFWYEYIVTPLQQEEIKTRMWNQGFVPIGPVADEFDVLKVFLPRRFGFGLRSGYCRPLALKHKTDLRQELWK